MFGREERQMTRGEQVGVRDTEIQVGKPGEERRERWAKEREEDTHTHTHTHRVLPRFTRTCTAHTQSQ